tara:strand:+ start:222 stop:695 length:474 start_codon:yes stop_codon:yes gene_type:complete
MKKLLGIVILGLLWCNVGFAETRLDCKYYDSYQLVHTKTTTTSITPVTNVLNYITIILDMENKKIISAHSPGAYGLRGSKQKWLEENIIWYRYIKLENEKKLIDVSGSLNRYSLTYTYEKHTSEYSGVPYDKQNPLKIDPLEDISISWRCEIKKKKL